MITYNNIIEKLSDFVENHFFLQAFEYGYELENADLEKFESYPILFANYTGSDYDTGTKSYSFEFLVFDVPTDKDSKEARIREVISDSEQCLEDLLADIRNGFNVFTFDEDYEVEGATIVPVAMEGSNVYSGALLTCDIIVGYEWDACEAPLTGVTPPPSSECASATYQNSDGTFTQEIGSGSVFTSTDITITQADGSTTTEPTNKDVTCAFPQLTLQNSTPQNIGLVTEYPAGGNVAVIDTPVANSDASYSVNTPSGVLLSLPDINVTDVRGTVTQVPSVQDVVCSFIRIDLQNTLGTLLESITAYPSGGKFTVSDQTFDILNSLGTVLNSVTAPVGSDVTVNDVNFAIQNQNNTTLQSGTYVVGEDVLLNDTVVTDSSLATFNTETALSISLPNTTVNSVSTVGGVMTINTPSAATPSGICYQNTHPSFATSYVANDSWDSFIDGDYDRTPPTYPAGFAQLDYSATQSDIRVTPATGTSGTDPVGQTWLKSNNAFGNKYRFTDDQGNASDATVGSNMWAHVDWNNHSWTGATADYVIDHLTGWGYTVKYADDGGKVNLNTTGNSWSEWITYISTATVGSYSGFIPLDLSEMTNAHGANANPTEVWADNFFEFDPSVGGSSRGAFLTGESYDASNFYPIYDTGNADMMLDLTKAKSTGFQSRLTNVFMKRKHY